jgi:hypothetical protein
MAVVPAQYRFLPWRPAHSGNIAYREVRGDGPFHAGVEASPCGFPAVRRSVLVPPRWDWSRRARLAKDKRRSSSRVHPLLGWQILSSGNVRRGRGYFNQARKGRRKKEGAAERLSPPKDRPGTGQGRTLDLLLLLLLLFLRLPFLRGLSKKTRKIQEESPRARHAGARPTTTTWGLGFERTDGASEEVATMEIVRAEDGKWQLVDSERVLGTYATNAEAWRALDRSVGEPVNPQEKKTADFFNDRPAYSRTGPE